MRRTTGNTSTIAARAARKWEAALRDLERVFGIGITIHDLYGELCSSRGEPLLPGRHRHPHAVCQRREKSEPGAANCVRYCAGEAHQECLRNPAPRASTCWKGVCEVLVPVVAGGRVRLILFAGPFRDGRCAMPQTISLRVRKLWEALPVLRTARRKELARTLELFGKGLWSEAEEVLLSVGSSGGRRERILRFLGEHAHEQQSGIVDLAQALHLSPGRAGHVVRELFGQTWQELLLEERLRRVRALLAGTDLPVGQVAERVGIPNTLYFFRLFKRAAGQTPLQYRRSHSSPTKPGP